jgi:hypothetical protein
MVILYEAYSVFRQIFLDGRWECPEPQAKTSLMHKQVKCEPLRQRHAVLPPTV